MVETELGQAVLESDVECVGCGRSLRGRPREGRCVACGMSVTRTMEGADAEDAEWLERVGKGVRWFYCLAVLGHWLAGYNQGSRGIQSWLIAAAAGVAVWAAWNTTSVQRGRRLQDPEAWLQRAARVGAVGLALAMAWGLFGWMGTRLYPWEWGLSEPGVVEAIAYGLLVVTSMRHVSGIAEGLALGPIGVGLRALSWVAAGAMWPIVLWNANPEMASDTRIAFSLVVWLARLLEVMAWAGILLLLGRVLERIAETRGMGSVAADGRAVVPVVGKHPWPRERIGWGVVMVSVVMVLLFWIGSRWWWDQFVWLAVLGAYLAGVWIIMKDLGGAIGKGMRVAAYASGIAILIGGGWAAIQVLTAIYSQKLDWAQLISLGLAMPMSMWVSFAMLAELARRAGNGRLGQAIMRRGWVLAGGMLAYMTALVPYVAGLRSLYPMSGIVDLLLLFVVAESVLVLGRAWQATEGRVQVMGPERDGP